MDAYRERVLYPNRWKMLGFLVLTGGFTAIGIWMIVAREWLGWLVSGFFGLGVVVFAVLLLPNSAYLRLDSKGFEVCSLFRAGSYRWSEVAEFGVAYVGLKQMVVFNFSPSFSRQAVARKVAVGLSGWEGALPDSYGMSFEELATLLNEYKEASETT